MKQLLILVFIFLAAQNCLATEWLLYYVYVQTDYVQGPWKRTNILDKSGSYLYLHPEQFEELFGTEKTDLAIAILNHLKKASPERYTFNPVLSLSEDTVVIQTTEAIADFDAVKNELTASFTLNNFPAVKIIRGNHAALYQLEDISIPYMDLVFPQDSSVQAETTAIQKPDSADMQPSTPKSTKTISGDHSMNPSPIWLIISTFINIILLV
ncbi:MAG TPA: hypothetical protein PLD84_00295, partial [Chitinophagales bacterium]|nr:hypothetical protein [Chitinophagales bacterium]